MGGRSRRRQIKINCNRFPFRGEEFQQLVKGGQRCIAAVDPRYTSAARKFQQTCLIKREFARTVKSGRKSTNKPADVLNKSSGSISANILKNQRFCSTNRCSKIQKCKTVGELVIEKSAPLKKNITVRPLPVIKWAKAHRKKRRR